MSSEEQKEIQILPPKGGGTGFLSKMLRLLVAIAIVAVVLWIVVYFVKRLIWWICALGALILLAMNYKFVMKCIAWVKAQYQKNVVLGVVVTVLAIAGSSIFMGFLLLKTIWDFTQNKKTIQAPKQ